MKPIIIILIGLCISFNNCENISQTEKQVHKLLLQANTSSKDSLQKALTLAQKALITAQKNHYINGTIKAHHQLAKIYCQMIDYNNAKKHAQKSLNLSTNDFDMAISHKFLGMAYLGLKQYKTSLDHLTKSLTLMIQSDNEKETGPVLNNIGNVYCYQNKNMKALDFYEKAAIIMKKYNSNRELAKVLANTSLIYKHWGLYDKALEYSFQSLQINQTISDQIGLSYAYSQIAKIYNAYGLHQKAIEYYHKALKIQQENKLNHRIAATLNNIAVVYISQKNYKQALKHLKRSLQIKKKLHKPKSVAFAHKNIGATYNELGDYANAFKHLHLAKKYYQKNGNKDDLIEMQTEFAYVYKKMGQPHKALLSLVFDYQYFKNSDSSQVQYKKLKEISETYKQLGNYKKSYYYYLKYTALKEKTFNEQFKKQLIQINILSEQEKKKKDILLLKKDKDKQKIINTSLSFGLVLFLILIAVLNKMYHYKKKAYKLLEHENTRISSDIDAIIKASQTISSEVVFSNLIDKMFGILAIHSQAQKIVLLLNNNGNLSIEAVLNTANTKKTVYHSIPEKKSSTIVPLQIINHVDQKRNPLLLKNVLQDDRFNNDPYVAKHKLKSIYCIPVLHKKNLIGILYLENNKAANVFTSDHIEIINILASQVAISLENAKLYEELDNKVLQRTGEVQRLNKLKDKFLAIVVHDLKNPLLDMKLNLNKKNISKKHIENMKRTTDYMFSLLEELLDIAVIESGNLNLVFSEQEYNSFLMRTCENKRAVIEQKNIHLKYNFDPEIKIVYLDEKKIIQVINNLLSNAIKYSPCDTTITVSTHFENRKVKTIITDQGPGIPIHEQKKIFNEFKQADNAGLNSPQGTGLGLAIVKKIIEAHNGKTGVESKPGNGASFYFTLPVYYDE